MKPNWLNAPDDARYLAEDTSGDWWWYTDKPYWDKKSGRWFRSKGLAYPAYRRPNVVDPVDSLESRP